MGKKRRKPRLFAFPRHIELTNLGMNGLPEPDLKVVTAALDAFLLVANRRAITPELLTPIVAVAMHPNLVLRGLGTQRLVVMAHYFPEAQTALQDLCNDADSSVRSFAVANLANGPWPQSGHLVRSALEDPNWKVRRAAAQVCSVIAEEDLADAVEARLTVELQPRVQVALANAKQFQRGAETAETEV
jgi:hypothetical protein